MNNPITEEELGRWAELYGEDEIQQPLAHVIARLIAEVRRLREENEQAEQATKDARFVICMEREGHNWENDVCLGCGYRKDEIPKNHGGP